MSVMAGGSIEVSVSKPVPHEVFDTINKQYIKFSGDDTVGYCADFDGNWRLCNVIDAISPLSEYVENGNIIYWSDEGDAHADFINGCWCEEWEERYYPSDLPTYCITATERVAEILNIVASDIMDGSESSEAIRILFDRCNLSDKEIKLFKLQWLEDLCK